MFGSFVCARVCVFVGPEVFVYVFVAPWGLGTQRLLIFMFVSGQHVAVHNVLLTVHNCLVTGTMLLSLCCRHEFTQFVFMNRAISRAIPVIVLSPLFPEPIVLPWLPQIPRGQCCHNSGQCCHSGHIPQMLLPQVG